MKKRVLIVTCEMLPLPGMPVRGGGLRVWGLGEGLRLAGHEVRYSIPAEAVTDDIELPKQYASLVHEPETLNDIILEAMPDVVIVEQWGLASFLDDLQIPLVIDLHGPLSLENAFKEGGNFLSDAHTKIDALAKADMLICPGEFQKQYFLAWYLLAGADPQKAPIEVVPVAMGKKLPDHSWPDELKFMFGGVTWPWIDPFPGLETLAKRVADNKKATLDLYVGAPPINYNHPLYAINKNIFRDYRERLEGHDRVALHDFIPRDELLKVYGQASVAYDLYQPNSERQLAFTTRTIEYLWCGLPVIYGDYGELAGPIREYDAGWVVDPTDAAALNKALDEIFASPDVVREKGENARKLAAERYTFEQAIKPLARFVENPKRREKEGSILSGFRDYFRKESVNQILDAKNEIAELNAELRRAANQSEQDRRERDKKIEDLSDQVKELIREHDKDLKKQAEQNREEIKRKEDDLRRLQEKLDHELATRDEEIKRLHVDRQLTEQKAQDEIKRLNQEKEQQRENMAAEQKAVVEKKDEELKKLKDDRETERDKLQSRVDILIEEKAAEKKKADEEIKALNKEKEETRKTHEQEVKKLVEKAEAEAEGLKRQRDEAAVESQRKLTREIERREDLDKELNAEIKRLNLKIGNTAEEHNKALETLRAKHEEAIQKANDQAESQIARRDETITKLTDKIEKLREDSEKRIKELDAEKTKLADANRETVDKLKDELTTITAQMKKTAGQIEERDERIQVLEEDVDRAREKALGLEKELQVKLDDNQRLVKELDELNAEIASKLIDLERVVFEKERYVEESEKRFNQMEDHAAKQQHQLEIVTGAVEQAKRDVEKSNQALADRVAESDSLRGDLDKIRRFARDLEGEVASLRKRAALQERLLADFEDDPSLKSRRRRNARQKRLLTQLPRLAYLFVVNLATNAYMEGWQKRTGKKIFPGT